jgi:hypothetical protein
VYRAFFVHDFLELCVVVPRLLAMWIALNIRDFLVWLALLGVPRVVPLALVEVAVAIALLIVVVLGAVVILLILLVSAWCHHVTELHGSSRAIVFEVVVRVLRDEPFLKQRMTSSLMMLVMMARVSKKHQV